MENKQNLNNESKKQEVIVSPFKIDAKLVLITKNGMTNLYAVYGDGKELLIPSNDFNKAKHYLVCSLIRGNGSIKI